MLKYLNLHLQKMYPIEFLPIDEVDFDFSDAIDLSGDVDFSDLLIDN